MTQKKHVVVLLSSFNGEAYIEEQIDSILNQEGVSVNIAVRDDGSTDNTVAILNRLANKHPTISVSAGTNIGVVNSFFALMSSADEEVAGTPDYYAFADQDDVWLPEKLRNATNAMAAAKELQANKTDSLLMYCSAVEYVDANLNHLGYSPIYSADKIGYGNALVQNCATGCTIVLNRAALSKIVGHLPALCVMHDWWIYLVLSAFGEVIYDPRPGIKYRQHNRNVMGVALSSLSKFKRRWMRLFSDSPATKASAQLGQFEQIYGAALNTQQFKLLHRLAQYKKNGIARLAIIFDRNFYRQNMLDDLLIRLTMLIGKF